MLRLRKKKENVWRVKSKLFYLIFFAWEEKIKIRRG